MSFKCEVCDEAQPIGHAPIQVVTQTRTKRYSDTSKIGIETVKEVNSCPPCSEVIIVKERDERTLREAEVQKLIAEQKAELDALPPRFGDRPGDWRDGYSLDG